MKYGYQKQVYGLNCNGDSDKKTSGGWDHPIETWSPSQSGIALPAGDAEMFAINKTAATGVGGQSMLNDLGETLELRVFTDATTGKHL